MISVRTPLSVYVVDDEPLAVRRLTRMLRATGRVEIAGSTTNPEQALEFLSHYAVDAVFLDIQMPGMTGFELLGRLSVEPTVVFTTAFDQYALTAFEVNSIDYLLKPIEAEHLNRALTKLERRRSAPQPLNPAARKSPERLASRLGDRIVFVDVALVTHFYARDKLTYASTPSKDYVIDNSIAELEQKLDPAKFVRVHRSTLLNLQYIDEVSSWFGGGIVVRLKDGKRTELQVARDRVRDLKARLDF